MCLESLRYLVFKVMIFTLMNDDNKANYLNAFAYAVSNTKYIDFAVVHMLYELVSIWM